MITLKDIFLIYYAYIILLMVSLNIVNYLFFISNKILKSIKQID